MLNGFANAGATFGRDERGSTAIMFSLCLMPAVLLVGCAVDYARGLHAQQKIAIAADTAALAAAKALKDGTATVAEAKTIAETYFKTNIKGSGNYANISRFQVNVNPAIGEVNIDIEGTVQTLFAAVAGINGLRVGPSTTAVFATRDIEVGMALDVTGSMHDAPVATPGGPRKIDTMKKAVAKFATQMIPDVAVAGQSVRIGLAPYSAAANLGSFASAASGGRSADGCVTERKAVSSYSDDAPSAGRYFAVKSDGSKDIDPTEGNVGNEAYTCPSAKLVPLTSDRKKLIDTVNTYSPNGWTAGHFGAQWAWNIVSDEWGSVWGGTSKPDSYARVSDGKLVKAVILMTDGVFNTAYHNTDSAYQATRLCQAMKDKGVIVFSIAFDAPAGAKKTLQACATAGDEYYADASDEADLDAAFSAFAGKIKSLHLSR